MSAHFPHNPGVLPTHRIVDKASTLHGREAVAVMENTIQQNLMKYHTSSFAAEEGDLFIVTYPKCGTTWVQQIAKLIRNNGQENGMDIDEAFPWIELMSPDEANTVPHPRGFKSHLPYKYVPGGEPSKTAAKYISVYRNPKDAAVSAFHHQRSLTAPELTWDDFFEGFISGTMLGSAGKCVDHFLEWWNHRDSENILVISYEWMKAKHEAAVSTIANFMGYELTPAVLSAIVTQTNFDSMKSNPAANMSWMDSYGRVSGVKFMRKGKVGDWKNYFTDEQSARLDEEIKRALEGSGLEFEYSLN